MVVGLQSCLGWLLCMANTSPETTENLFWFPEKWFFNPWECRVPGMQKVASTPASLAASCTLTLLKDVRVRAVWMPFHLDGFQGYHAQIVQGECGPYSITTVGPCVAFHNGCAENTVTNAAGKLCPTVSCSLTACEWVPDFSALRLIEIVPFSQNDSDASQQFKQAVPSVSTGLTMWQWLGCCNVQHSMKACFYLLAPTLICSKLFPRCP